MSLGSRLLRIARRRVLEGLGFGQGADFRNPSADAREELEAFLREQRRRPGPEPPPVREAPEMPPACHPYAYEYRLLGAPVGSDLRTVRRAWRRLVRETHPDRFAADPQLQRRANDRLRRINAAYERLKRYLESS